MKREEFEEFYDYITKLDLHVTDGEVAKEVKSRFWETLRDVPLNLAMSKALEVYKALLVPCNLNQLNPKVYSGENPNPGLFAKQERYGKFYH